MKTAIDHNWIDRFNEGDLSEQEKVIFLREMKENPALKSEVELDAKLTRFLADSEIQELMHQVEGVLKKRRFHGRNRLIIILVLVAMAIITAVVVMYMLQRKENRNTVLDDQHAPLNIESPYIEPEKYGSKTPKTERRDSGQPAAVVSDYEVLVSSKSQPGSFKLTEPSARLITGAGEPLRFAWLPESFPQPDTLVILSESGVIVTQIPIGNKTSVLLNTDSLASGKYYWKLNAHGNMIVMGRFTCRR